MSEHNHPDQKVEHQYNADAISIHLHHAASSATGSTGNSDAQVREELELFKSRFARTSPHELRGMLVEAEDLLTHVCGRHRYASLLAEAETAFEDGSWYRLHADLMDGQWPELKPGSGYRQRANDAGDDLKKRVAGIKHRQ